MTVLVPNHKTSEPHRAAIVSIPMTIYIEMMAYHRMIVDLFGTRLDAILFFLNQDGTPIDSSSRNNVIYKNIRNEGEVSAEIYSNADAKLLTTAITDADPTCAALVATQLSHIDHE